MQKAKIEKGQVVNLIEVDPAKVPDWCADWPDAADGAEIGGTFDGAAFTPAPRPVVDPAEALAAERARMVCSPLQGKLTLGETAWVAVEAWRDTYATWAQRQIIDSAREWDRLSENMQFIAYLLGYTDEQVDALFRQAMQVKA